MENILDIFYKFKKENNYMFLSLDGINGDCFIFARHLYLYYLKNNIETRIYTLNKGVHYWIEFNNYAIDSRGVFTTRNKLTAIFKKYIVKENTQPITLEKLNYIYYKNISVSL